VETLTFPFKKANGPGADQYRGLSLDAELTALQRFSLHDANISAPQFLLWGGFFVNRFLSFCIYHK
jgi:hypothetical protein